MSVLFNRDINGREISISKISNVKTTNRLAYPTIRLDSNGLFDPVKEKIMSLSNIEMSIDVEIDHIVTIEDNPVFFFAYNMDNYFHFIYDSLPYLISFLDLRKKIQGLKLLMGYSDNMTHFYPFVTESLQILNISLDDICILKRYTQYTEMYLSTSFTHAGMSNHPPREEIYEFYQSMLKGVSKPKTPPKIYVSRRTWVHNNLSNIGTNYTTRRTLENEDHVVKCLIDKGFVEVFPETMTMVDKISLFANAKEIIGPIGGGMVNVLFSPKKTLVGVIVSPTFLDTNMRFSFSFSHADVSYLMDTFHSETTYLKTHMRVKILGSNKIGEIVSISDPDIKLMVTDGTNSGWNASVAYPIETHKDTNLIPIDGGLNSPWFVDQTKLDKFIESF